MRIWCIKANGTTASILFVGAYIVNGVYFWFGFIEPKSPIVVYLLVYYVKIFLDNMLIQISLNTQEHLWQGALSVSKVLDALRERALIAKEHYTF